MPTLKSFLSKNRGTSTPSQLPTNPPLPPNPPQPIYSPLNSHLQEIRLLHIQPGVATDPLFCTLSVVSLHSNPLPAYRTLSYTWGDPNLTKPLYLNGQSLHVTSNLHTALTHLRDAHSPLVIWADAVCINQKDLEERGQQVGLMQTIYTTSHEVMVWIGEAPAAFGPTRKVRWTGDQEDEPLLHRFWADFRTGAQGYNQGKLHFDAVFHAFAFLRLGADHHAHELPVYHDFTGPDFSYPVPYGQYQIQVAAALEGFVKSPWWSRLWTIQECVLPKKVTFLYGPVKASFNLFDRERLGVQVHETSECCASNYARCFYDLRTLRERLSTNVSDVYLQRFEMEVQFKSNLWKILKAFRHRSATDDRDKIFGLLGMVTAWYEEPIVPSYTISVEDLYIKTTTNFTLATRTLWAMQGSLEKQKYHNLPSWVMDWTNLDVSEGFPHPRGIPRDCTRYGATGDTESGARLFGDRILSLDGVVCDRITAVGRPMTALRTQSAIDAYCDWFLLAGLHENPHRPYPSGGTYMNAYWRCLCGDTINGKHRGDNRRATDADYDAFVEWFLAVDNSPFHWNGLQDKYREALLKTDERFHQFGEFNGGNFTVRASYFSAANQAYTFNRSFFITEKGYLGVGPVGIRTGDEVWCLYGGKTPFILRVTGIGRALVPGESHKEMRYMVGDCYLHGFMDGEVLGSGKQAEWTYLT